MKVYRIPEFGSFIAEKELDGYIPLPQKTFDALENFLLNSRSRDTDALELMTISARKGIGKVITAKNYVGTLAMKDGAIIEILPKVWSVISDDNSGTKAKKLLLDMLKTLRDSPFKNLQTANVNAEKMSIFEVFIRMFINEIFSIVKRGLKCGYETVEENGAFFKGKMKFSQQIRHNIAHKERCFVEYDTFQVNRPENRLIKATLQYLYPRSASAKNRNDIKTLLTAFADVEASRDYKSDFGKYILDRNTRDYANALQWCRVFLEGKSFTSFAGSEVAVALLFPMETLFESYVAELVKRELNGSAFTVSIQDKQRCLFDQAKEQFPIKPDIVLTRKSDKAVFILDTKWKILAGNNGGISQADMYQMIVYQKKYGAEHVTLIYPRTDQAVYAGDTDFRSRDGDHIRIRFVDLFDVQKSIEELIDF